MMETSDAVRAIRKRADEYRHDHVVPAFHVEPDHGEEFCLGCADAEVAAGKAEEVCSCDPSAHYDSPPHCARCGATLEGWLTDHGARQELGALEDDGFDPNSSADCYAWVLCENNYFETDEEHATLLRLAKGGEPCPES